MKTAAQASSQIGRGQTEALIAQRMATLFMQLPTVCGFSLSQDLAVVDLMWHTWPGLAPRAELYEDIADAIGMLLDERPDAAELLRGRTFARAFH